jgi:hypothetical protein
MGSAGYVLRMVIQKYIKIVVENVERNDHNLNNVNKING